MAKNEITNTNQLEILSRKLEVFIITYNRSSLLLNTLEQLKNSPFAYCKITVLNNRSTDNTLEIANSKEPDFRNYCVISNKVNIGLAANIIRAIELSNGIYTWVLCDDDNFDFSDCDDVINAIITESYDLIHMGAHPEYWKFGSIAATPKDLLEMGYPYFKYTSFLPCNLFRTQRFYNSIIDAYNNIPNWYPQLPFLLEFLTNSELIYIAKNRVVTAGIGAQAYSYKELMKRWFNCSDLLSDRKNKLLFLLNQRFVIEKDKRQTINNIIFSFGKDAIRISNLREIIKLLSVTNFQQSILLLYAILIGPMLYVKQRWL